MAEMSEILHHEVMPPNGMMVSVTVVRSSPDLRNCKIFLSVFPDDRVEELFQFIEERYGDIKKKLGHRIGKQVRYIPEISFYEDDTMEYAEKMDQLIDRALDEEHPEND